MQSERKKKTEVTLKPSELRAFLYGRCYNFYKLASPWKMTRSSYCRYRESMGQRHTIKKPENDGIPVKRWNRTPWSAELWASRQAGGGPEMEKTEQSVQRWHVEPPHPVGPSTVPEIPQIMATLG